jgi:plasmid stability protein
MSSGAEIGVGAYTLSLCNAVGAYIPPMASLTVRNLGAPLETRLRVQAAIHGRSMGEEAREILRLALSYEPAQPGAWASALRARFTPLGGVELPVAPREAMRPPPAFDL